MPRQPDLLCFSHLRWDFVFQRPNHLMSHCADERRVFFIEEPVFDAQTTHTTVRSVAPNLFVVQPKLVPGLGPEEVEAELAHCLRELLGSADIRQPILWFYTPMALPFARDIPASLVVYDCMDELSAFQGAESRLGAFERELFERADLVFTGGSSLYSAKRAAHADVHLYPSSVDVDHFAAARFPLPEPEDQVHLGHPRLGFFGVIDERMDLGLLDHVARARPDWQLVMVGPVVKISPESLPRHENLHYLGQKSYADLPRYLAGWDVALMPFARNEATRYISPTKTLEYLAGGKPVVSTPIRDVVSPYAEQGLVRIGDGAEFVAQIEAALNEPLNEVQQEAIAAFLRRTSWKSTWCSMSSAIQTKLTLARERVAS